MSGGITDISPVIDSYTDALLDVFPQVSQTEPWLCMCVYPSLHQARYQPMDLYFKTRVWVAHHLPEAVYERLYIGQAAR